MGRVIATVQLLTDEGKAAADRNLNLEVYNLGDNIWQTVATRRTDAQGKATITTENTVVSRNTAPSLRLVEPGEATPRVLAYGGLIRYDQRRQTLFLDFGKIERLEETAHRLQNTDSRFEQADELVAGAPVAPHQISRQTVDRMIRANPGLIASLPGVHSFDFDEIIGTRTDSEETNFEPQISAEIATNIASNMQLNHLKNREAKLNSQLIDRDRELIAAHEELRVNRDRVNSLKDRLSQAEQLNGQLRVNTREPESIVDIVEGLASSINDSNNRIKALPYQLGNVKVDLRGLVLNKGKDIVMGETGGGVSTELINKATSASETEVTVPEVLSLTENAARRVLRSVGLRMTTAHQRVSKSEQNETPGQALSQHPSANSRVNYGSSVLVVFGAQ